MRIQSGNIMNVPQDLSTLDISYISFPCHQVCHFYLSLIRTFVEYLPRVRHCLVCQGVYPKVNNTYPGS